MPRLAAMLVAESAVVDAISNRVSVFHLTDTFNVLPGMLAPIVVRGAVVLVYETDAVPMEVWERVVVRRAGLTAGAGASLPLHITVAARGPGVDPSHTTIHLLTATFPELGEYEVAVEYGESGTGPWRSQAGPMTVRRLLVRAAPLPNQPELPGM